MMLLASIALVVTQPLGPIVQKQITTSGDPEGLELVRVEPLSGPVSGCTGYSRKDKVIQMASDKPTVYILRGDDREQIESRLNDFSARLGEPDMAEMNTSHLEGKSTSLNDLRSAALAMPFLTERRLVIMEDAIQPFSGRGKEKDREAFLVLLESLPPTTALVLVIPDSKKYSKGSFKWETLKENHC